MKAAASRLDRILICAGGLALLNTAAGAETIYRCESADGGLIYSDRPCAADATVYASDGSGVTVYAAPPISEHASQPRPKPSRPTKSARNSASQLAKRQATCAKLDRSSREVRTRLRTGYGVKEGERLKARQRQLAERRRQEKCR